MLSLDIYASKAQKEFKIDVKAIKINTAVLRFEIDFMTSRKQRRKQTYFDRREDGGTHFGFFEGDIGI